MQSEYVWFQICGGSVETDLIIALYVRFLIDLPRFL